MDIMDARDATHGRHNLDTMLTIPEAAKRLRLGRSTVYHLAQRGELPSVRIGRSVRVRGDKLDAWLDRQADDPEPENTPS